MSSRGEHIRLRKGDVVGDRYEMLEEIGCGNFSKVYSCLDLALPAEERKHRLLAMKVMKKEYRKDAYFENKMLRIIAENDPHVKAHVCRLVDVFEWRRCPVFIMSMHGPSLRSRRLGLTHGVVTRAGLLALAYDVCESLRFIHFTCNMVHTDLKPENILIMDPNTPERAFGSSWVLCDFGSSSLWRLEKLDSDLISTRPYRAPEVVLGNAWHYAADMWSLGCILYEVATGHRLFEVHDDKAHLQLMIRRLGRLPELFTKRARLSSKFFNEKGELLPGSDMLAISRGRISRVKETFQKDPEFCSLLTALLAYNPEKRLTATQALLHPVFQSLRQKRRISTTMLRAEEAALRAALSAGRTYVNEPLNIPTGSLAPAEATAEKKKKKSTAGGAFNSTSKISPTRSSSSPPTSSFASTLRANATNGNDGDSMDGDLSEPAGPAFSLQELTRLAAKMPLTSSSSSTLPHNGGTPSVPSKSTTATNSSSAAGLVDHHAAMSAEATATAPRVVTHADAQAIVRISRRTSAAEHATAPADAHALRGAPNMHLSAGALRGAETMMEMEDSKASTLRDAAATSSSLPTAASTQTCRPGESSETHKHPQRHSNMSNVMTAQKEQRATNTTSGAGRSLDAKGHTASAATPLTRAEPDPSITTAATAAAAVLARMRSKLDQVGPRRESITTTTTSAPLTSDSAEQSVTEKPSEEGTAQAKSGKEGLPSVISIRAARRVSKSASGATSMGGAGVTIVASDATPVAAPVTAKASSTLVVKPRAPVADEMKELTSTTYAVPRATPSTTKATTTTATTTTATTTAMFVSTKQPPQRPETVTTTSNNKPATLTAQQPCIHKTNIAPPQPSATSTNGTSAEVRPVPGKATPPLPLYVLHASPIPTTTTMPTSVGVLPHVLSIDSMQGKNGLNASGASSNATTTTTTTSVAATHTITSLVDEGQLSSFQGSPITLLDSTVVSLHANDHPSPRRRCRALPSSMNMSPGGVFSSFYSGPESPLTLTQTSNNTTPLPHLQDELDGSTMYTSVSGQAMSGVMPHAAHVLNDATMTVATPNNNNSMSSLSGTQSRTYPSAATAARHAVTQVRVPPSSSASSSMYGGGEASHMVRLGGTKAGGLVSAPVLLPLSATETQAHKDAPTNTTTTIAAANEPRRKPTSGQPQAVSNADNAAATSAQLLQLPANARPVQKQAAQMIAKPPQTRRNLARYDEDTQTASTVATQSRANTNNTPFADPGAHALYKMIHGKSPSREEYGTLRAQAVKTTLTTSPAAVASGTSEKGHVQAACPPPSLRTRTNLIAHTSTQHDVAAQSATQLPMAAAVATKGSTNVNSADENIAKMPLTDRGRPRRSSAPVLSVVQRRGPNVHEVEEEVAAANVTGVCVQPLPLPRRTLSPSPAAQPEESHTDRHTVGGPTTRSLSSRTSHEVSREPAWSTLSPLSSNEREGSLGEEVRYSHLHYPHRSSFQAQSRIFERNIETLRSQLQAEGGRRAGQHHSNTTNSNNYHSVSMSRAAMQANATSKQRVYRSTSATVSRRTSLLCVNSVSDAAAVTPVATESVPSTTRNVKGRHADPTTDRSATRAGDVAPATTRSTTVLPVAGTEAMACSPQKVYRKPSAASQVTASVLANVDAACATFGKPRQTSPVPATREKSVSKGKAVSAAGTTPAAAKAAAGGDADQTRPRLHQRIRRSPPNAKGPAAVRTGDKNNNTTKGGTGSGVVTYAKSTMRPGQVTSGAVNEDMPVPPPPTLKRAPRRSK